MVFINCDNCFPDEPATAQLHLSLEPEQYNDVIIKVYRGPLEDSVRVDSIRTQSTDYTYKADVSVRYTFTAEYLTPSGVKYIAVNSAYPRVVYDKNQCQDPCYYVYDTSVNLRLKYH